MAKKKYLVLASKNYKDVQVVVYATSEKNAMKKLLESMDSRLDILELV